MHIVMAGSNKLVQKFIESTTLTGSTVSVLKLETQELNLSSEKFSGNIVNTKDDFQKNYFISAGIENCDYFFALTNDQVINFIFARIAKEVFNVPEVISLIDTLALATFLERFNIKTISSQTDTLNKLKQLVNPHTSQEKIINYELGIGITEITIHPDWVGKSYLSLTSFFHLNMAFIVRNKKAIFELDKLKIQDSDIIYVYQTAKEKLEVNRYLATPPV